MTAPCIVVYEVILSISRRQTTWSFDPDVATQRKDVVENKTCRVPDVNSEVPFSSTVEYQYGGLPDLVVTGAVSPSYEARYCSLYPGEI